jgi:hypothetical protein
MMETNEKTNARGFNVALLTPYLSSTIENIVNAGYDPKIQIDKYGFDQNNLNGVKVIETEKQNKVFLIAPVNGCYLGNLNPKKIKDLTLAIAGCTEQGEEEVRNMKGSRVVVARYSIFYGGKSDYTGSSPEEAGYSLDIPKNIKSVIALLRSDEILEAIQDRDGFRVKNALSGLNTRLEQQILATPYLEVVLN